MVTTTHVLEFTITASHVWVGLPSWHHEARVHEHHWRTELHLVGSGEDFAAQDWDALQRDVSDWASTTLEHRHLNQIVGGHGSFGDFAQWVYEEWKPRAPELDQVRVSTAPGEWTAYQP